MFDVPDYLGEMNLPDPSPEARANAYRALRERLDLRAEVRNTQAALIPASVLNQDSSVSIYYIRIDEMRLMLRVIETEEAARAAAAEALEPEMPCFLPEDFFPDGASVPTKICVRTR